MATNKATLQLYYALLPATIQWPYIIFLSCILRVYYKMLVLPTEQSIMSIIRLYPNYSHEGKKNMNILTLQKELIQAYQKVYFHQEQEKQKRGYRSSPIALKRRLEQLQKIIVETKRSDDLIALSKELQRCKGYFYLHPDAEELKVNGTERHIAYMKGFFHKIRSFNSHNFSFLNL